LILRTIAALLLALLASGPVPANAQSSDAQVARDPPWPVTRLPFTPRAIEGEDNAVCGVLVEAARTAFVGSNAWLDLYQFLPSAARIVTWDRLAPPFPMESGDNLSTASVDLDGDGRVESLLKRSNTWSWRGPSYSAYVYRDTDTMRSALSASANVDDFLKQGQHYLPAVTSASQMTESESWAWNDLFEWGGSHYFLGQGNQRALLTMSRVDAYRLEGSGVATRVCRLEVLPAAPPLASHTGLAAFVAILRSIGRGGPPAGTGTYEADHDNASHGFVIRAGIRPWAMVDGDVSFERTEEFIRDWSLRDPWSRREYLTYVEHRESAFDLLSDYLAEGFGMTEQSAAVYAEPLLKQLVVAHFVVPGSFPEFSRDHGDVVLRLLEGIHLESDTNVAEVIETAIDNPRALRAMLERGADPDTANVFGKTLLMYAAHLNRPDAVAILLSAGADVNAETNGPRQQGLSVSEQTGALQIERGQRTALLYAAENASVEVMAALVDAGALVDVVDSRGEGVAAYLARNPRYPGADDLAAVLADYRSSAPADGPSFSCGRATTRVEKAVCSDAVAALYDRELAAAYTTWREGVSDASDARADQRAWLRRRNAQCESIDDDYALLLCVQQTTRARTRYIENRLAEPR